MRRLVRHLRSLRGRTHDWWARRFGDYARREREAMPDGTRVRLVCQCGHGSLVASRAAPSRRLTSRGRVDTTDPVRTGTDRTSELPGKG